ncbi:peroxiredoxin family protein [Pseudoalteromonas spongiae]|uniref:Redoxin domain-containing protein n=1 Tax=Pseudoalteromonas spongiae TaxID=298657 RepID=A0ABU8EQT2_9GAMM
MFNQLKALHILVVTLGLLFFANPAYSKTQEPTKHTVFMDIWSHYDGANSVFINWLNQQSYSVSYKQQDLNVTPSQIAEFKSYYPQFASIEIDKGFKLMRQYGVWQTPFHIIEQNGTILFKGDDAALLAYLKLNQHISQAQFAHYKSKLLKKASSPHFKKQPPVNHIAVGEQFSDFVRESLSGQTVSLGNTIKMLKPSNMLELVFLDSLCPMPHFPNCEASLKQLADNQLKQGKLYLAVISGYYVNEAHVRSFIETHQLQMPVIWDSENVIFKRYGVSQTPYKIVIDHRGTILKRHAF